MSFVIDTNHHWRATSLHNITVTGASVQPINRSTTSGPVSKAEDTAANLDNWLANEAAYVVSHDVAEQALGSKTLRSHAELANAVGAVGMDGAIRHTIDLPYDYFSKDTECLLLREGQHMRVAADINEAHLNSMIHAQSVESFAKSAELKLPRITATNLTAPAVSLGPNRSVGYNEFEALRWAIAKNAATDDYGFRLHSLARVVCHAILLQATGQMSRKTPRMVSTGFASCLTAELPQLTLAQLNDHSWWYITSDLAGTYRAFLAMGGHGLQHFVPNDQRTIYSRCVAEPEIQNQVIVFVRQSGDLPTAAPTANHYTEVLNSAEMCVSYYYAYASSLGIQHQATQVLLQTALGPHIWGPTAVLPYKAGAPKLDAATYLLRASRANVAPALETAESIVFTSAVFGQKLLAGLGAVLTSYKNGRKISMPDIAAQIVHVLNGPEQTRSLLRTVHNHLNTGYAALEWINPFYNATETGFNSCVAAFRQSIHLLSQYSKVPVMSLQPLFTTGVDMRAAVPGASFGNTEYSEIVTYELAAGMPITCQSERLTQNFVPNISALGLLRSWTAVCAWVRYTSEGEFKARAPSIAVASDDGEPGPALTFVHQLPPTGNTATSISGHSSTTSKSNGILPFKLTPSRPPSRAGSVASTDVSTAKPRSNSGTTQATRSTGVVTVQGLRP